MSAGGDSGQKGPAVSAQEAQMQAIMQQARVTVHTQTHHTCSRRRPCFDTLRFFCTSSYIFLLFCYFPPSLNLRNCTKMFVCCISTFFYNLFYHFYFDSFILLSNSKRKTHEHTHTQTKCTLDLIIYRLNVSHFDPLCVFI